MTSQQTVARSSHDLGAAAWFGGALMGAVGLHEASAAMTRSAEGIRVAEVGWKAWQPWKIAAITVHVAGSLPLLWGNKARLTAQHGAMTTNVLKTSVFAVALGADAYAAGLGRRVAEQQHASADMAVEPSGEVAEHLQATRRKLRIAQWAVPVLVGLNIVLGATMGEQQRATSLLAGVAGRLDPRR